MAKALARVATAAGSRPRTIGLLIGIAVSALGCGAPYVGSYGYRPYVPERSGSLYGAPYHDDDYYPGHYRGYYRDRYYEPGFRRRHDPCVRTKRGSPIIRELKWYRHKTERVC